MVASVDFLCVREGWGWMGRVGDGVVRVGREGNKKKSALILVCLSMTAKIVLSIGNFEIILMRAGGMV